MLARRKVKVGLVVRRSGNPRTEIGRLRKAQTFTITEVFKMPGFGFQRALLEGHGQALWVSNFDKWEEA